MNKIKQNKITFSLILLILAVTFSSLTILSLPVLFNYKSKVIKIEKNFYNNFKIYLKTTGNISYKPFPKPHLLVENASLKLSNADSNSNFINTSNLKIFISLRDVYLRSFKNLISTEISNTNLEFKYFNLKDIRKHLYQKVNKPITFINCKFFLRNKNDEVILISPINKIDYKINNKSKIKIFSIYGEMFGLNFKSVWKRNYNNPKQSIHSLDIFNSLIKLNNRFKLENTKNSVIHTNIEYGQDKIQYKIDFIDDKINIISPDKINTNFNIDSSIQLNPFNFNGMLTIKNRKVENIIDNFLLKLFIYDKNFLGNFDGNLKIKFEELNNKIIKNGEMTFEIGEKKINLKNASFKLNKIGEIKTDMNFVQNIEETKFKSKNQLIIENYIEFAKVFQIGTKKVKKIKDIYFDLERNIGDSDFTISNVRIDDSDKNKHSKEIFTIKNIQNLRSYLRNVID